MEKRVMKFELDVGTSSRITTGGGGGGGDDLGKALELVQRERDRDVQEKQELRHLNDRFSHFLSSIEQLKRVNEQLQSQLQDEFAKWGILPRDENDLRQIIDQINAHAIKRATDEVHARAAEQEAAIMNRGGAVHGSALEMYKRKQEHLQHQIDHLQEELNRTIERERVSDEEVMSTRDDLTKSLSKFRERLQDWLRLVIDKQTLLDDIQSLRERINLINALNDEEINEWKRLLDQSKDDSMSFYRDELTNAIRDIKRDYSKQAKKFQDELEYQIEGQLRMVESQLKQMPGSDESALQESAKNRMQLEETKLRARAEEYEKEQARVSELTKLLSDKRRLMRDEEAKLHEIERKIRDKQIQERTITERLKHEYDELRARFEQMAFELRFSIEDELTIYARLLDELMKKSSTTGGAFSKVSSTVRSAGIEEQHGSSLFEHKRSSSGGGSSGIFDPTSHSSGWPPTNTTSGSQENLFHTNEHEIHETFDGSAVIRSSSFSAFD